MIRKDKFTYHLSVNPIYVRTEFSVITYTYVNTIKGLCNRLEKAMLILGFSLTGPNGYRYRPVFFKRLGFCTTFDVRCSTAYILKSLIVRVLPFGRLYIETFNITIYIPCGIKTPSWSRHQIIVTLPISYLDKSS